VNLLFTQDDFTAWEGEATGKGKERHLFLFENKLILTRKRKSELPGDLPTYEFRGMINVRFTWSRVVEKHCQARKSNKELL